MIDATILEGIAQVAQEHLGWQGPLTADAGYYGQPTGSMPTTSSTSSYFVDVVFEENP